MMTFIRETFLKGNIYGLNSEENSEKRKSNLRKFGTFEVCLHKGKESDENKEKKIFCK